MKRYVLNTDLFEDEFYIKGSRYNKEPKWSGHIEIDEKDYLDFIAEQTTRFIAYLKDSIRSVHMNQVMFVVILQSLKLRSIFLAKYNSGINCTI